MHSLSLFFCSVSFSLFTLSLATVVVGRHRYRHFTLYLFTNTTHRTTRIHIYMHWGLIKNLHALLWNSWTIVLVLWWFQVAFGSRSPFVCPIPSVSFKSISSMSLLLLIVFHKFISDFVAQPNIYKVKEWRRERKNIHTTPNMRKKWTQRNIKHQLNFSLSSLFSGLFVAISLWVCVLYLVPCTLLEICLTKITLKISMRV